MIDLKVQVDRQLVDLCEEGSCEEIHDAVAAFCGSNGLDASLTPSELLNLQKPILPATYARLHATSDFLAENTERSVAHIRNVLPSAMPTVRYELFVKLLPFGRYNFGPRAGLQIFSLYPDATPEEAYLFMVHIYYHELSHLFYSDECARCSTSQDTVDDLIYWLKLLIRNEGIANYSIIVDLRKLIRDNPEYSFRYFTYARHIDNIALVRKGIALLDKLFADMDDGDVGARGLIIVQALKSKLVPIINLLGIHMASKIADRFGAEFLRDVYKRNVNEFFGRYAETGSLPLGVLSRSIKQPAVG